MKLFLRHMCDQRFKEILQADLELIGEVHEISELEQIELDISPELKYEVLNSAFIKYFSEISNTARSLLFEKIKATVSEALHKNTNGPPHIKYPVYLSDKLHHSFHYLSTLFSEMNGCTLEKYIIAQRIEVAKHMLVEQGMGLAEIAWRLGYCSVSHLSNQFKKITGSTPMNYKCMAQEEVISLGILCEPCKQRCKALLEG